MSEQPPSGPATPSGSPPAPSAARWQLVAAAAVLVALVAVLVAIVAARDSGDDGATRTPTTSGGASPTTTVGGGTATSVQPSTTPAAGCTGPAPTMSHPASVAGIVDVDADGRPDTAWLASPAGGGRELGVRTASGGGDSVQIESASPSELTVLVADADQRPPVELFVSDNRTVQLWAFQDCALQPVTDRQGQPYLFDLGFRGTGTGVGCIDADHDGDRDLVGLNITGSDQTTVRWSRTVIERDGLLAANGATSTGTFQAADDAAEIALLTTVSCGDQTIDRDGLRQPT